jgi:PAS domain S-box-containing protein
LDNRAASTVVSPENSVDGNVVPVAGAGQPIVSGLQPSSFQTIVSAQNANQQQPQQQLIPNLAGLSGVPVNPLGMQQNQFPVNTGTSLVYHNHAIAPDPKRMRVDGPVVAPAQVQLPVPQLTQSMPAAASLSAAPGMIMMNVQQLAVAAMQQQQQGRGRKKSQAQIDRRRERNRILARRTRLRKKFFFEALQKDVMDLQRENIRLKAIVRDELPDEDSKRILDSCDAAEKMPPAVLEACGDGENGMDSHDYNLVQSIQKSQHCFIITDPSLADNSIVFASDDFLRLTGYSREQVLGRNCRFLQGTDTCVESVQQMRKSLAEGEDVNVTLLNYKADGTPFWNRLFIAALRDAQNNIVNFIGVIAKVPAPNMDGDEDDDDLEDDDDIDGPAS